LSIKTAELFKNLLTALLNIFLAVWVTDMYAQTQSSIHQLPQLVYRNWNNQNGLPQNTINDLGIDGQGYLWIATEEGLVRFDGATFLVRNESNTENLFSGNFTDICVWGDILYAASRNTVVVIQNGNISTIDFRPYLTNAWIKCIETDDAGRTWVGTSGGDIYQIEKGSVVPWKGQSLKEYGPIEVMKAKGQSMMVGTAKGLLQLDHSTRSVKKYTDFEGLIITAMEVEKDGQLWIGTAEKGLYKLLGDQVILHLTEGKGLKEQYINSLSLKDKELWIGTRSSGYQVYKEGVLSDPSQFYYANNGVKSILHIGDQITWLGTMSSGLIQALPAQIQMFCADKKLSESIILPIYQHKNKDIWVGTAGNGLFRITNGKVAHFMKEHGLSSNLVLSVYGTESYVYIGTSNGLDRFNLNKNIIDRRFTKEDGLTNNSIQSLLYDSQKRLWITTRAGGVHILKNDVQVEKVAALPETLNKMAILNLFEDRSGNIWFGSRGGGMLRLGKDAKLVHFNQRVGFNAEIVYNFYEDAAGAMWMATDKGLYCYYKGKFTQFDKTNGLRFNESYRIMEDSKGFLWLSGNFGLQRIALAELREFRDKQVSATQLSVTLFNTIDGMANAETNGGFSHAGWKMQDGKLWFPTVQGVAIVDPERIIEKKSPVHIQLESFRYGNREFTPVNGLKVPPGINNIEIHFTSIDFTKANDINYYYRLKQLGDEWKPLNNRKVVYFTGLAHGNYTFEVKAERYGQWSEVATQYFTIEPYFYQSVWFKALTLVLCMMAGFLVFRYQKKREEQKLLVAKNITKAQIMGQEKERQVIGVELHDNINQQLATVKLYLDIARSNENGRLAMVEKSEQVVHNVINEIRLLCKTLTPPTLKDIGLNEALHEMIETYRVTEKYNIHYTCPASLDDLEEGLRFSIFRIVQELLHNIQKHAHPTNVFITIDYQDALIKIQAKDDGVGFNQKEKPRGAGFTNISNRLELYNGTMTMKASEGAGCIIDITIPVT